MADRERVAVTLQAPNGERGVLIGPATKVAALVRPEAVVEVHRLVPGPAPADVADQRPAGDTTSGRVWSCFCGEQVPSWDLQDHLIGHA